uniref:Dcun1d4 protein n=1 Tax=Mus musculus TaxID=10090 RepID=Q8K2C2_MOUSE|nr:Dcun1d4 protein [Mus musculus]
MFWSSAERLVSTSATTMKTEHGQFCWTNLWNGIKTSRCPRTLCLAARVTVPTVMSPISHKLLSVWKRMLLFLHRQPLAGRRVSVFAIEWAALLDVALFSWRLLCSSFSHYRLVNLPTSSL